MVVGPFRAGRRSSFELSAFMAQGIEQRLRWRGSFQGRRCRRPPDFQYVCIWRLETLSVGTDRPTDLDACVPLPFLRRDIGMSRGADVLAKLRGCGY